MQSINPENITKAEKVLYNAFIEVPGFLWILKKDKHIKLRIQHLISYCLEVSIQKNGAYISEDKQGVALLFESVKKQRWYNFLKGYFFLGQNCIGWDRAWHIYKREKEIQARKPKINHLYFWMLAVNQSENGNSTIIEIRDFCFALSKEKKLPILAETTVKKNLIIYKRYGFEIYDSWYIKQEDITVWFLKRDPI